MSDSLESNKNTAISQLKRLRHKAELCRFSHDKMQKKLSCWNIVFKIVLATLSTALAIFVTLLYRKIGSNDFIGYLILLIACIPPLILFFHNLCDIFGWEEREKASTVAVKLWGNWVREADFLEKKIQHINNIEAILDRISEIERKYTHCMDATPLIPTKRFLYYKAEYRKYKVLSKKIEDANLDELPQIVKDIGDKNGKIC